MSYNGSGTFNINTSGQPVVTGTVISSTAFNALTADLGTGLSTAITKDGQTTATARIPFAAGINSSLVTDSTSTTTGSIITAGGVGIAKSLYVGTGITGALNGTVGATTPSTGAFTTLSATGTLAVGSGNSALKIDALGANNFEIYNGALTADGTNYAFAQNYTGANTQVNAASGGQVLLQIAGATKATLDSSGNLGLGGTPVNSGSTTALTIYNATAAALYLQNSTSGTTSSDGATLQLVGADLTITNRENGYIRFNTNNTERARIDSSGNLLVGATSNFAAGKIAILFNQSSNQGIAIKNASVGDNGNLINFYNSSGTLQGYIEQTNSTTVGYITSSDYRMKENVQPISGALAKVAQLKPVTYRWKDNGFDGEGFIAHELAEVCPHAVSGVKDAVEMQTYEISPAIPATQDEEGNELTAAVAAVMGEREVPKYQGVDTSFLVATLTAAIQEQQAIITALTTRITALENK